MIAELAAVFFFGIPIFLDVDSQFVRALFYKFKVYLKEFLYMIGYIYGWILEHAEGQICIFTIFKKQNPPSKIPSDYENSRKNTIKKSSLREITIKFNCGTNL